MCLLSKTQGESRPRGLGLGRRDDFFTFAHREKKIVAAGGHTFYFSEKGKIFDSFFHLILWEELLRRRVKLQCITTTTTANSSSRGAHNNVHGLICYANSTYPRTPTNELYLRVFSLHHFPIRFFPTKFSPGGKKKKKKKKKKNALLCGRGSISAIFHARRPKNHLSVLHLKTIIL